MVEINIGFVLATLINFGILYFVLKHFLFDKVKNIIEEREEYINEQIDEAEEATETARMMLIENERILSSAKKEGKKITASEKKKAEKIYEEIITEAREEANIIVERAKIEINREREKVEVSLKNEAIELAIDISKKVIEKNIDEEKNRELIKNFISEVGK